MPSGLHILYTHTPLLPLPAYRQLCAVHCNSDGHADCLSFFSLSLTHFSLFISCVYPLLSMLSLCFEPLLSQGSTNSSSVPAVVRDFVVTADNLPTLYVLRLLLTSRSNILLAGPTGRR